MTEQEAAPTKPRLRLFFRRIISFVAPILVATALLLAIRAGRRPPSKRPINDQGRPVRVIEVQPRPVVPKALGYGVVEAAYKWELVAQVSGRVVEMNSDLRVGKVLPQGTKLLKIDAEDYELAAEQRQASLQNVTAQIEQLEAQRQSVTAQLKIEEQSLALAERDLQRYRALFASGGATQADVDNAQRNVLVQRSSVQSLRNQLRELPASIAALQAQERESKAGLQSAALDIERTEIAAPFDIRIRELSIQPRELVTAGQVLAVADGIDAAEVPAQLTFGALQPLYAPTSTLARSEPRTKTPSMLQRQLRDLGIKAIVRIESGELVAQWRGEVTRITNVNSTTRTLGVVVTVGDPLDPSRSTPPLLSGLYAEVEFSGQRRPGCLAVPRSALRSGDQVYVVDPESRLARREVEIAMRQAAFVCVQSGLEAGDQVVLTDLTPAVQGMLLAPVADQAAAERLLRDLEGEGSAK